MRKQPLNLDPLGALYEPLHVLATRVHRALRSLRKTVWADGSGKVFKEGVVQAVSTSPRWVIGSYNASTPVWLIEEDLRHALRVRASLWITDWQTIQPAIRHHLVRPGPSRVRRGPTTTAAATFAGPPSSLPEPEGRRPLP